MNQRKGLVMREIRLDEMAQFIDLLNYVFKCPCPFIKIVVL